MYRATLTATDEGTAIVVSGTYSDPGIADTHEVTIDWGLQAYGGMPATDTFTVSGGAFSKTYTYTDDGGAPGNGTPSDNYVVDVSLKDDDNGEDTSAPTLTVNNVAPTVTLSSTTNYGMVTLDVNVADPGSDGQTVQINWGDGFIETWMAGSGQYTHTYFQSGTYSIAVVATDDDTGVGSDTESVTINWSYLTLEETTAATHTSSGEAITMEIVNEMLPHAAEYWREAGPNFQAVDIRIVDLPGMHVAAAGQGVILIDQDAAGYGWFAEEHAHANELAGRVDLLSALSHEVGHLLGHRHDEHDHGVMGEHLSLGIRSLPEAEHHDHDHNDHELGKLAVDSYFKLAMPLSTQRSNSALRSELFSDNLLTPSKDGV